MDSKRINIDEYLYKYGLHDTVVDKIYVQGDELVFCFDSGIYILDENGKEMEKTSKCLMCIKIEGFDIKKAFEHIEIYEFYKDKKIREIELEDFIEKVNKFKFDIMENYYSYFLNGILLEGYSSKYSYQIKISEIKKNEFKFEVI